MIRPTSGTAPIGYFRDFFTRSRETERAVFRTSASVSSSAAMPSRITIVSRAGEPFLKHTIASRRTATFGSRAASSWSSGRNELMSPGMCAREAFERDQRRPAHRRAVVLEPATEQVELLAEAELRDRAVGERAHPVVVVAGGMLDLVGPLAAERRELLLVPAERRTRRRAPPLARDPSVARERPRAGADVARRRANEPARVASAP